MELRRLGVRGKNKPVYPDVDEVNKDRRSFLMKLGAGVLGLSLTGLAAGCRTSGDITPPVDPLNPNNGGNPEVPTTRTGGVPRPVAPPEPIVPPVEPDVVPLPGEPLVVPQAPVQKPWDERVQPKGDIAPPPDPNIELRKPGEAPAVSLPNKSGDEPDVVEEPDVQKKPEEIPVLGGVIMPPQPVDPPVPVPDPNVK